MSNKRLGRSFASFDIDSESEDEQGHQHRHLHSDFKSDTKGVRELVTKVNTKGSKANQGSSQSRKKAKTGKKPEEEKQSSSHPVDDNPTETFVDLSDVVGISDLPVDRAYITYLEESGNHEKIKKIKPKGDEVLRQWTTEMNLFVEELLRWDGRGQTLDHTCVGCKEVAGTYECIDCRDRVLWCKECLVKSHYKHYLHRIQVWNGSFFEKTSLRNLGLRIQLGKPGHHCSQRKTAISDDFTVIHVNGIHQISVDFCACGEGEQRHIVQLLRVGMYPGTIHNPQTAASFDVLDLFELMTFSSQISGFEFYQAMVRMTCNTGLKPPKDRYLIFLRMTHEWRHLHMIMRAGAGHHVLGVTAMQEGEMALLCPACPHPGKNMPDGWESSNKPYTHRLFLAIDANFRLKRKNISDPLDPGLVKGGGYFVEDTKYRAHLKAKEIEKDPKSTCSRHDAVNLSSSKGHHGYAASGVGKVCCARHDMHLPSSMGDLQVGERYANMDYLFFKTLSVLQKPLSYVVSYDIACQWSVHLKKRLLNLDANFFLYSSTDHRIRFLVPKFHLPAHISKCRRRFSFNYCEGVGRTDGEAPERGWPVTNALSGSTREMLAGTRRDVIEYQVHDYNWVKITNLAALLRRRLYVAAIDEAQHTIEYDELSGTIPDTELNTWIQEIDQWSSDPDTHPYPFEPEAEDGPTLASVRLELAEAEARALNDGQDKSLHDEVSPSVFIDLGVSLESKQRSLKKEIAKVWDHAQDRQKSKAVYNTNTLQREIDSWLSFQALYCPSAERIRSQMLLDQRTELRSYDYPLLLPSSLKGKTLVDDNLIQLETKFRKGQAYESLAHLRSELQIRYHIQWAQKRNARGQAAGTRANQLNEGAEVRVKGAAEEYRTAYAALVLLDPNGEWAKTFKPLERGDIRHISELEEGQTLGTQTVSWIWLVSTDATGGSLPVTSEDTPPSKEDLKHVKYEWGRCRARMTRFGEEVHLVTAEMDRTKRYHRYMSSEWTEKALQFNGWALRDGGLAEGLRAYAYKKAKLFSDLEGACVKAWANLPQHAAHMQAVSKTPSLALPNEFAKSSSSKAKARMMRKTGGQRDDVDEEEE